jgi:hypothetical protein
MDPNRPTPKKVTKPDSIKCPPNAFFLFSRVERASICERYPRVSPSEVSSLLSHLWRSLDEESKARYKSEEVRLHKEFFMRTNQRLRPEVTAHQDDPSEKI